MIIEAIYILLNFHNFLHLDIHILIYFQLIATSSAKFIPVNVPNIRERLIKSAETRRNLNLCYRRDEASRCVCPPWSARLPVISSAVIYASCSVIHKTWMFHLFGTLIVLSSKESWHKWQYFNFIQISEFHQIMVYQAQIVFIL